MLQQKPSIFFSHQKKKNKNELPISPVSPVFWVKKSWRQVFPNHFQLQWSVYRKKKKKHQKTQRGKTIKVMIRVWLPGTGSLTVAGSTGMMHQKVRELLGDKRKALINCIYLEP